MVFEFRERGYGKSRTCQYTLKFKVEWLLKDQSSSFNVRPYCICPPIKVVLNDFKKTVLCYMPHVFIIEAIFLVNQSISIDLSGWLAVMACLNCASILSCFLLPEDAAHSFIAASLQYTIACNAVSRSRYSSQSGLSFNSLV
jgi:hypothetical protein